MTIRVGALAVFMLVALVGFPAGTAAVELRLTDDARTSFDAPGVNPGQNSNLRVSSTVNSYLKFDLSPLPAATLGSDVAKATLKLWADNPTIFGSFDVRRVNGSWTEESITWNTAPPLGTTEATGSVTEVASFVVVDVTQLVKDWLDGIQANHGLALVAVGTTDVTFDSKEDPQRSHEPRLEVVLAGDITAVNAGTGLTGGGTKGDVTLSVDTAQIQKRVIGSCAIGSAIREIDANGLVTCEVDDNSGGTITGVTAGAGLTGGGTTGSVALSVATGGITSAMIQDGAVGSADVNAAQVQLRVAGTCQAGNAIRIVNADGTVTCEPSGGLDGSGTVNTIPKFTAATTLGNSAIVDVGGNVGIGTTNPAVALQLGGTTGSNSQIFVGATTNPGWTVPAVQLGPQAAIYGGGNSLVLGQNVYYDGTGNGRYIASGVKAFQILAAADDGLYFRTAPSGVAGNAITFSDSIYISGSSGNVGIGTTSPASRLHVVGDLTATGSKNFQIAHPVEPGRKLLVHSALEGPEAAVFYRGEAALVNGEGEVTLPPYFEALTRREARTVQLTPIGGFAPLYVVDEVREGRFTVRTESGNPTQRFYWEVKAVRADIPALVVEKLKGSE